MTSILLDYVNMDTFAPSAKKTTLIKVYNANNESAIHASSSWEDLDLCCPRYNAAKVKKVLKTVNDSVERIRKVLRDSFYILLFMHNFDLLMLDATTMQHSRVKPPTLAVTYP